MDTIVALSSGSLPAGVAVIRTSGPASVAAIEALAGPAPALRRASLRRVKNARGEMLDRGLVLFFDGPNTVTGEDVAEFHLHGGRAVVAACLEALLQVPEIRLAEPGEFTRRAFENGRIDLTEAEGLADLLAAETEAQRRQALAHSGGALRRRCDDWMQRLTYARAMLEASIDFADEGDVDEDVSQAVRPAMVSLAADMRRSLLGSESSEIIRHGFRVAIAGAPNAGKSSLLNALADRDVAIVSPVPGTTRDVIEVRLDLGGVPVRCFDTAGLRDTDDEVEAIGVHRARETIGHAHLVLLLDDGRNPDRAHVVTHVKRHHSAHPDAGLQTVVNVHTKADLRPSGRGESGGLRLSVKTGEGLPELMARIAKEAANAIGNPSDAAPTRLRQREIISAALSLVDEASAEVRPAEVSSELLRRAGDQLGHLTGRVNIEDILDVIFAEFCIGK